MKPEWIAQRLHMGSWTYVSNLLNEQPQTRKLTRSCGCVDSDTCTANAVGHGDVGQAIAASERVVSNAGEAVGDRVAATLFITPSTQTDACFLSRPDHQLPLR
jgi:hypothetical protein